VVLVAPFSIRVLILIFFFATLLVVKATVLKMEILSLEKIVATNSTNFPKGR